MSRAQLYCGDALAILQTLPDESVQCVVTSPPYFGLRDYGMSGQLGSEASPADYVARLVAVFRAVRRVLAADGSAWLNLGDSYATREGAGGLKAKDLIGIPWMSAFALRADGWWLRSDVVWAKPNGMPESVQDRPTRSHEYLFQVSKSATYFYDADAARTPMAPSSETRLAGDIESQAGSMRAHGGKKKDGPMKAVSRTSTLTGGAWGRHALADAIPEKERRKSDKQRGHSRKHEGFNDRWDAMERTEQQANGANLRSVWWIAPAQYRDAHFAVMPEKLATICIAAGSRPGDTVLDPFGGSGTVAAVATGMGRSSIYIDLNPNYLELAKQRIGPMLCDEAVA